MTSRRLPQDEAQQLWQEYRAGDRYALAKLMQRYYTDLFHWGMRLRADRDFVKDCIQEVFVNLWTMQESIRSVDNVRSYLLVVLKSRILRELSATHNTRQATLSDEYAFSVEFAADIRLIDEEHEIYQIRKLEHSIGSKLILSAFPPTATETRSLNLSDKVAEPAAPKRVVSELETASTALDATKPRITTDVLYAGDITKWKRLGYSLLLRAGMRLSKVNPAKAAEVVAEAVAGGVMQTNDDNTVLRHTANFQNPVGPQLNGGQADFFYLAEDFVTYLKANNDPRLASIAVRYVGAKSTTDQKEALANRTPGVQIGMPLGYDNTTVSAAVAKDKLASLYEYSQLDRTRMASALSPTFFVTYAQTQLLLAEAVVRKWTAGNAATLYTNGIQAHLRQLALYGTSTAIAETAITAYVQANPLAAGKELEQINTQYWVASFLNGPEAWANFRRSGFPSLTPNPFPGSDLKTEPFIRRLTYTDNELNVNKTNVQQAISRQGPDLLDTRVWWDKK